MFRAESGTDFANDPIVAAAREKDIREVADMLGVEWTTRADGTESNNGSCPICGGGEDRFNIWPDEDRWHCRHCETSGDTIALVMAAKKIGFIEAIEDLTGERPATASGKRRNKSKDNDDGFEP